MSRSGLPPALASSFLVLSLAAATISLLLSALRSGIRRTVADRLRRRILDAVVTARPSAAADARRAATLAGEGMARESGFLGGAVLTPALCAAALLATVAHTAAAEWRLAVPMVAGLVLLALAWPRRMEANRRLTDARLAEGVALRRALLDLVRRLPALRAHGTEALERRDLERTLLGRAEPLRGTERRAALATALALLGGLAATLALPAFAGLPALQGSVTPGKVTAAMAAAALAVAAIEGYIQWRRALREARPIFEEIAGTLGRLQSRGGSAALPTALPETGRVVIEGLAAHDSATGARLGSLDTAFDLRSHVALVGSPGSGAPLLAAVLGGRIDPADGRLTLGDADLADVPGETRSRLVAYAGGETVLIPGTLRTNLLYGCADAKAADIEQRLIRAVIASGLDHLVQARSLSGALDVHREPALAEALVAGRAAVRAELAARGLGTLVDPFDAHRYNRHATIGENIRFGVPLGDTFREANLPTHSFLREILRVEGLSEPLAQMGLSVARSTVEMFADLPEGSPLFERFSLVPSSERAYLEDLVRRARQGRGGSDGLPDRDRLIGLALLYCETRHRLGLVTPELEQRLLRVRAAFADQIPASLKPALEFYDPRKISRAANVQDNLLFGRIAQDRAGAEEEVRGVLWRVLGERGLVLEMFRVGLETAVDARGSDLAAPEVAAIDVARCLVREPAALVIEHALSGLNAAEADLRVARLRRAQQGRGLVLVTSELSPTMDQPPFPVVIRFQRGSEAQIERRP